jgi:Uncharacterized Fe-S oxidoreductase
MTRAGYRGPADLARASGLDVSVVSRWLRGQRPTLDTLRSVSEPLGVPLLELAVWAGLITADEAGQRAREVAISPEDALRADETLTEEGRRAGLASLDGLRRAFGTTGATRKEGRRKSE